MSNTKWTPKKRDTFLNVLRAEPNISEACRAVGLSRSGAYALRDKDTTFATDWDDAWEEGVDALEHEADLRARKGSDVLLIFRLKALRPDKYRDNVRQELTGKEGAPLEIILRQVPARGDQDA